MFSGHQELGHEMVRAELESKIKFIYLRIIQKQEAVKATIVDETVQEECED